MATQSLYRRYRPRRFSELKGQDHVVRALRDAVATGREGQAYLFSGPRGTGKTTSARILAKALNCENVVDGEPCCECDSCLAVERGVSYDVHELDAASNNGVDAIRDLVEKASLGTPGRHKVYILDEVHMLSKAAEAALLKTLEEPPPHVVFVLATTDPQKMSDTIRSRTQHLQFHLLPADTLSEHVRWVAADAGLTLTDEAFDAALTQGGGSARDTLSALELIASTGGDVDDAIDLDEFVDAMIEHDPGRALTTMAQAVNLGRDPRTITEDLIRHLRNSFLSLMAPELVLLPSGRIDDVAQRAKQLGAAAIVRAIERLGATLADMRHAPDPRVLVEVALVQLTHDDDGTDASLRPRLDRLEQQIKQLSEAGPAAAPLPTDPTTGKAKLGGAVRQPQSPSPTQTPTSAPAAATTTTGSTAPAATGGQTAATPTNNAQPIVLARVIEAWDSEVKGSLKPLVRALYSAGSFVAGADGQWRFEVPNEAHGAKCEPHRGAVEAAMSAALGAPFTLRFVTGGHGDSSEARTPSASDDRPATPVANTTAATSGAAKSPSSPPADKTASAPSSTVSAESSGDDTSQAVSSRDDSSRDDSSRDEAHDEPADAAHLTIVNDPPAEPIIELVDDPEPMPTQREELPDDDDIDLSDLTDAPPSSVKTPIDHLAEAFPGSELIAED